MCLEEMNFNPICFIPSGHHGSVCGNICFGMGARASHQRSKMTCSACRDTFRAYELNGMVCDKHGDSAGLIVDEICEACVEDEIWRKKKSEK